MNDADHHDTLSLVYSCDDSNVDLCSDTAHRGDKRARQRSNSNPSSSSSIQNIRKRQIVLSPQSSIEALSTSSTLPLSAAFLNFRNRTGSVSRTQLKQMIDQSKVRVRKLEAHREREPSALNNYADVFESELCEQQLFDSMCAATSSQQSCQVTDEEFHQVLQLFQRLSSNESNAVRSRDCSQDEILQHVSMDQEKSDYSPQDALHLFSSPHNPGWQAPSESTLKISPSNPPPNSSPCPNILIDSYLPSPSILTFPDGEGSNEVSACLELDTSPVNQFPYNAPHHHADYLESEGNSPKHHFSLFFNQMYLSHPAATLDSSHLPHTSPPYAAPVSAPMPVPIPAPLAAVPTHLPPGRPFGEAPGDNMLSPLLVADTEDLQPLASSSASTASPPAPRKTKEKNSRGIYLCGRCGQPKANHVCPFTDGPLMTNKAVQTGPMVLRSVDPMESHEGERILTVRPRI